MTFVSHNPTTDELQTQFPDRVRFNWGYHDAAADFARGRDNKWAAHPHPDNAYKVGYLSGWNDSVGGLDTEDSTEAWHEARAWGDV